MRPEIPASLAITGKGQGFALFFADRGVQHTDLWLVAQGTDNHFYLVPSEPGGWLKRTLYAGPVERLTPVSVETSLALIHYLYGDVGPILIMDAGEGPGLMQSGERESGPGTTLA